MTVSISPHDRFRLDGELVTVAAVTSTPTGYECIVRSPTRGLVDAFVAAGDVDSMKVRASDGSGDRTTAPPATAGMTQRAHFRVPVGDLGACG